MCWRSGLPYYGSVIFRSLEVAQLSRHRKVGFRYYSTFNGVLIAITRLEGGFWYRTVEKSQGAERREERENISADQTGYD